MVREGVLHPKDSSEYISRNSKHVLIHEEAIDKLCDEILLSMPSNKLEIPDTGTQIKCPDKEDSKSVDWIFVADSLNFCFWSYTAAEKWTVDGHSGYYALEAALSRAIKEGYDITNPLFYAKITEKDLRHILRSDTSAPVPLFDERLSILHEVGEVLLKKYNGTFRSCVEQANNSAMRLLEIIVNDFPCFRDEAVFHGKTVSLYKRAQILVADVWNFFNGTGWGEFKDIDQLTMFADYRVPQVLVYFGVMSYSDELMEMMKNDILLQSGSDMEVEIRGCSIHAVELLQRRIKEKIGNKQNVEVPNSCLIDYYLWCYRRKYAEELDKVPFHKTLGIYY